MTSTPAWPSCVHPAPDGPRRCPGRAVEPYVACLAHLTAGQRDAYLATLGPGSDLDHRGTTFSPELLQELLAPLRPVEAGRPHVGVARFGSAVFTGTAWFALAAFDGDADFTSAVFAGAADFWSVTFDGAARFGQAVFGGDARFGSVGFGGEAHFDSAAFRQAAHFDSATAAGDARFGRATFGGEALFGSTTFAAAVDFQAATFTGKAHFRSAAFGGAVDFRTTAFNDAAHFSSASFARTAGFASAAFAGGARFTSAVFEGPARFGLAVLAGDVDFGSAVFAGDADFASTTFTGAVGFAEAVFRDGAWFGSAVFEGETQFDSAAFSGAVQFRSARFGASADFTSAVFDDGARFMSASFAGGARFTSAVFTGAARFGSASFAGMTQFASATFSGVADFDSASFAREASFTSVAFGGETSFASAAFGADAWFAEAVFRGDAWFGAAVFGGEARFEAVTFGGEVRFGAASAGSARFDRARFENASVLDLQGCRDVLTLSGARFGAAVTIDTAAGQVVCLRTRWESTAALRMRAGRVDLSDAVLEHPLTVSAHHQAAPGTVGLESLSGADAQHVVLTDVDLTGCRFTGTVHLDQLRLEGRCTLATTPAGWRRHGLLPTRWSPRRTLAEEHHWRHTRTPGGEGWTAAPAAGVVRGPATLGPVYRQLRKSLEDGKNEPDAADFYYGEMEMRRHDTERPGSERRLLAVYWALSGYGLRASRALAWLLLAMGATVLLMVLWGLPATAPHPRSTGRIAGGTVTLTTTTPDPTDPAGSLAGRLSGSRIEQALRVVVNSVVFRSSGQDLTTAGTYVEMFSRFTEPTLLLAAGVAIRNRVKR